MSSPEIRARLAEEQAALVRAVAAQGSVPDGFDEERVRVTARSLRHKRLRTVVRTWSRLVESLGATEFQHQFLDYASQHALPRSAEPFEDGLGFVRWYQRSQPLPDAAHLEWQLAELVFLRRFPIRLIWLRGSRRLAVALRLPRLGVRVRAIRLPF